MPALVPRPRPSLRQLWLALTVVAGVSACTPPDNVYETQHLRISPDFSDPICAGTRSALDQQVKFVQFSLATLLPDTERIEFYWITRELDAWCNERASGCYYPGTRVIVGHDRSVNHEIVHAVLNAEADTNIFIEEALASLLSGRGVHHNPRRSSRKTPDELIWMSRRSYLQGDLDYRVASHFLHYIQDQTPSPVIEPLAQVVIEAADANTVRATFARLLGKEFEDVHEHYLDSSRIRYRGLRENTIDSSGFEPEIAVRLDCDHESTRGPRYAGAPGMYQVRRLRLDDRIRVAAEVRGHEGGWVDIFPAKSPVDRDWVHDHRNPDPRPREDTLRLPVGWRAAELWLDAGDHLIVFSRGDYARADISLHLTRLDQVDGPDIGPR